MSPDEFGNLLRRWWWLITVATVATATAAALWIGRPPEQYVAEGSYVVRVRTAEIADVVRATETLAASEEIVPTYAGVATSDHIRDAALATVDPRDGEAAKAEPTSSVRPDANILLIGARSRDPQTAVDLAIAIGEQTQAYVRDLGDAFVLEALDTPTVPAEQPRGVSGLSVGAGALAGLLCGLGMALAAEHRFSSSRLSRLQHIVDPHSTAYTRRYLSLRLREELSRTHLSSQTFSLGVLQVVRQRRPGSTFDEPANLSDALLSAITDHIRSTLRYHDVLAYVGSGRFAAILPDLDGQEAERLVLKWRKRASASLLGERDVVVRVAACEYESSTCIGSPEAEFLAGEL